MSVSLRPRTSGDASALREASQSTSDLATQFGGADLSTRAAAEAFIDQSLRFDERVKNWAVVEDGVAVGNVGASTIEFRHETAWMFYWLAVGARGKRYATGALIAVAKWAFENGLYRLELSLLVVLLNRAGTTRVAD